MLKSMISSFVESYEPAISFCLQRYNNKVPSNYQQLLVADKVSVKTFLFDTHQIKLELTRSLRLPSDSVTVTLMEMDRLQETLIFCIDRRSRTLSCISADDGHLFF
jgi:hypothetical protein